MKVSKSIWIKNKEEVVKSYLFLKPGCKRFGFLACFFLTACTSWPQTSERVISISEQRQEIPEGLTRDYLNEYVLIAKNRSKELADIGANHCLPGQMDKISKSLSLIKHEVDGYLLFDARQHLIELFESLNKIRNLVEAHQPNEECYQIYITKEQDREKGWYPEKKLVMPELSEWTDSAAVEACMRGQ